MILNIIHGMYEGNFSFLILVASVVQIFVMIRRKRNGS